MAERPDISIIGPGKVGTALGVLAAGAGWRVAAVAGRSPESARAAARQIGSDVRVCTPAEAAAAGGLVVLTVPDDAIAGLCAELAAARAFRENAVVAHCSGALASEVLWPAREACGCRLASMHPLQTFPTVEGAIVKLSGASFFIEGDEPAAALLAQLAEDIGGQPVRIAAASKPLYHAAAVMACNNLATLLEAAARLGEAAGIDRRVLMTALKPLVRATVENIFVMGPAGALTGPIERGDADTVKRHLSAMGGCDGDLREAYRALGRLTAELAVRKGSIDAATADAIKALLAAGGKE